MWGSGFTVASSVIVYIHTYCKVWLGTTIVHTDICLCRWGLWKGVEESSKCPHSYLCKNCEHFTMNEYPVERCRSGAGGQGWTGGPPTAQLLQHDCCWPQCSPGGQWQLQGSNQLLGRRDHPPTTIKPDCLSPHPKALHIVIQADWEAKKPCKSPAEGTKGEEHVPVEHGCLLMAMAVPCTHLSFCCQQWWLFMPVHVFVHSGHLQQLLLMPPRLHWLLLDPSAYLCSSRDSSSWS